jgi:hypothetical protein
MTLLAAVAATLAVDAGAATFQAAQAKYREADMVFVIVGNEFFSQPADKRSRQFAALRSCAKQAQLAGDLVVVTNLRGKIQYYADSKYTRFLQPLEWRWVKERANQKLAC